MIKEFGQEYVEYRSKIPMLIPKFNARKSGGRCKRKQNAIKVFIDNLA